VTQTIDNQGALDSLRITDAQASQLLNQLESLKLEAPEVDQRAAPRVRTGSRARVIVQIRSEGGTPVLYLSRPRNISRSGMAFLHGGYLHDGTRVVCKLKISGKQLCLDGKVVRCRFVSANIHEVGVAFDRRIDV